MNLSPFNKLVRQTIGHESPFNKLVRLHDMNLLFCVILKAKDRDWKLYKVDIESKITLGRHRKQDNPSLTGSKHIEHERLRGQYTYE